MGDDIDLMADLELADDPCPRGCGRTLEECEDDDQPCAGSPLVHELEAEVDGLKAELRSASRELKIHRAEMAVVEKAKAWRQFIAKVIVGGTMFVPENELIAAVDALPAETWKPAQPWQTPGGLTPEDDPPQPIGDPHEDDETMAAAIPHRCPACGEETTYQSFSGGREWYCPHCHADGEYPTGAAPRRVQMLADGRFDELRAEMNEELARRRAAAGAGQAGEEVAHECSEVGNAMGGYDCTCGEPWMDSFGGCAHAPKEQTARNKAVWDAAQQRRAHMLAVDAGRVPEAGGQRDG